MLEDFNSEFLLVCKLQLTNERNTFLIALYVPNTDTAQTRNRVLGQLKELIKFLNEKYRCPSIIIFTDFNGDLRTNRKSYIKDNLHVIFDSSADAYTRSQTRFDKEIRSYLDYFITQNLQSSDFAIG